MKWLLSVFLFPVLLIPTCEVVENPFSEDPVTRDTIPAGLDTSIIHPCVLEKALHLEARGGDADTVAIRQCYYNGQIVYLYNTECCDRYDALYDSSCQLICMPTGGIGGTGDGSCPDFSERAVFIKDIWRKY